MAAAASAAARASRSAPRWRLKGTGRLPVAICGDGDFLMGVTALWTAVHYRIPLLLVVANNRSFYNDELHQERVARMRNRPVENKWIGQRMTDPDIDLAAMARAQGAVGFGPVNDHDELRPSFAQAIAAVEQARRRRRCARRAGLRAGDDRGHARRPSGLGGDHEAAAASAATPWHRSPVPRPSASSSSTTSSRHSIRRDGRHLTAVERRVVRRAPGEFLSVIGPSGCGKSTLFNIIGGLLGDYRGQRHRRGRASPRPAQIDRHGVPGGIDLPLAHVVDNVAFPLEIAGMAKAERLDTRAPFHQRWSASTASRTAIRPNCRAACASASPSPARSPPSRRSC